MQTDECRICRDAITHGDVYCLECGGMVHVSTMIDEREDVLTARLHAWQISWHGPTEERWASLYRASGRGYASVKVYLDGRVCELVASGLRAAELGRWMSELGESFARP